MAAHFQSHFHGFQSLAGRPVRRSGPPSDPKQGHCPWLVPSAAVSSLRTRGLSHHSAPAASAVEASTNSAHELQQSPCREGLGIPGNRESPGTEAGEGGQ